MNRKILILFALPILVILDQLSKHLIVNNMVLGESRGIIDNIFHITYVQNTGAAFSILQGKTLFLTWITAGFLLVLFLYFIKELTKNTWLISFSLMLIIGGGIGNLIDRLRLGFVVDFIDFRVFPVFNVADIFVTTGCFFLIIYIVISEKRNYEKKDI